MPGARDIVYYGNGTNMDYSFDMGNRLSVIANNFQNSPFSLLKFEYDTYDNVGNRKDCDITLGQMTRAEYEYIYDSLYELKSLKLDGSNFAQYVYDKLGNRRKTIINSNTVTYSPDEMNKYAKVGAATLGYDAKGNLTYDGTYSYTYDCENRLLTGAGVTYKYDFAGRRIRKIYGGITTKYVYDGARVIAEYEDDVLVRKYVYGPGIDEPVCMISGGGEYEMRYYYHYDGLGSVAALSGSDGLMKEYYEYDAFGRPKMYAVIDDSYLYETTPYSSAYNPFFFTGREYEPENGLYYYRARFYHPTLGRFMQPDPIGYADSMNLYAYCLNDPVNLIDPWGLKMWSLYRWLYTGNGYASNEIYDGAVNGAAMFLLQCSPIRGGYLTAGRKIGKNVGVEAGMRWTMDDGSAIVGGATFGPGKRGRDPHTGQFVSNSVGGYVGGSYSLSDKECPLDYDYGVGASSTQNGPKIKGGGHMGIGRGGMIPLGLNYGAAAGGFLVDPSYFPSLFDEWRDNWWNIITLQ